MPRSRWFLILLFALLSSVACKTVPKENASLSIFDKVKVNICVIEDFTISGIKLPGGCHQGDGCSLIVHELGPLYNNKDGSKQHSVAIYNPATGKTLSAVIYNDHSNPHRPPTGNSDLDPQTGKPREPKEDKVKDDKAKEEDKKEDDKKEDDKKDEDKKDEDKKDEDKKDEDDKKDDDKNDEGDKDKDKEEEEKDENAPENPGAAPEMECAANTTCIPPELEEEKSKIETDVKKLPCVVAECLPDAFIETESGRSPIVILPISTDGKINCGDPRVTCIPKDEIPVGGNALKDKFGATCFKEIDLSTNNNQGNAIACLLNGTCKKNGRAPARPGLPGCRPGSRAHSCIDPPLCLPNSTDPRCGTSELCKINPKAPGCNAAIPASLLCSIDSKSDECKKAKECQANPSKLGCGPINSNCLLNPKLPECKRTPTPGVQPGIGGGGSTPLTPTEFCKQNPTIKNCQKPGAFPVPSAPAPKKPIDPKIPKSLCVLNPEDPSCIK